MLKRIDLHIHSNFSDGSLSPQQIVDTAIKNGVSVFAIADHDCILAYTNELFDYAKSKGVELIPAVEISSRYYGVGFHILGYNFDLKNTELINCLTKLKNARIDYLNNVTRSLTALGYHINREKLCTYPSVTKAHIAKDLIENPSNKPKLLKDFGHIPSKGEFIETIMNEGCPAFVEKFSITPIEASRVLHNAGGKVVLAHPVAYTHEDNISVEQISDLIQEMNADGIEANYIYVDRNNRIFDECEFWRDFTKARKLFSTIGSDFHLIDGIRPEIGLVNTPLSLTPTQIEALVKNLKSKPLSMKCWHWKLA